MRAKSIPCPDEISAKREQTLLPLISTHFMLLRSYTLFPLVLLFIHCRGSSLLLSLNRHFLFLEIHCFCVNGMPSATGPCTRGPRTTSATRESICSLMAGDIEVTVVLALQCLHAQQMKIGANGEGIEIILGRKIKKKNKASFPGNS